MKKILKSLIFIMFAVVVFVSCGDPKSKKALGA